MKDNETWPELEQFVREQLRAGFVGRQGLIESAHDFLTGDGHQAGGQNVLDLVARLWSERQQEQQNWSETSDYERIAAAFADLESKGVVARMNFSCCGTCGSGEIWDERTLAPVANPDGYQFREHGYVYFHQQDADGLAEVPALLYLGYGAFQTGASVPADVVSAACGGDQQAMKQARELSAIAVGHEVAAALRANGLTVHWDGDLAVRIGVDVTDWRKPLPV